MFQQRPAKQTVRKLWLEKILERRAQYNGDVPVYLTLAGAEGYDIEMLIAADVLQVTDTGAIVDPEALLVVAVESNSDASSELQRKFSGLEVVQDRLENLFHGNSVIRFPNGRHLNFARSLVVNLDLDEPLHIVCEADVFDVSVIGLLTKVAQVHLHQPSSGGWTLLLTLHGEIIVSEECLEAVGGFLADTLEANFSVSADFQVRFAEITGDRAPGAAYFSSLCTRRGESSDPSTAEQRQRLLTVLVPKLVVDTVVGLGWSVELARSAIYGGTNEAPMIMWIFDFSPATGFATTVTRTISALKTVGREAARIHEDGKLVPL
jgi:hypothetical protein